MLHIQKQLIIGQQNPLRKRKIDQFFKNWYRTYMKLQQMEITWQNRCQQFFPKRLLLQRNPVSLQLLLIKGHISDHCQGYILLLYKLVQLLFFNLSPLRKKFHNFHFLLKYLLHPIHPPQGTRWYNTTVVLTQTVMYPPYELLSAGITK